MDIIEAFRVMSIHTQAESANDRVRVLAIILAALIDQGAIDRRKMIDYLNAVQAEWTEGERQANARLGIAEVVELLGGEAPIQPGDLKSAV